jgi:hypothetical protein
MTENEVLEKFRGNAKLMIPEKQAEELIQRVQKLESVDNVKKIVELVILS